MILWPDEPLWVLDLETTGTDPHTALPVQVACGVVADHIGITNDVVEFVVDPGCEIPEPAAEIHGITTERAQAEGVPVVEAVSVLRAMLHTCASTGRPLVIYNARYDLTILDRLFREHDVELPELIIFDPFVVDRHFDKYRKGRRTLGATCEHYGLRLDNAHTAQADAIAAGKLMLALADVYPQLRKKTPRALHAAQVDYFERWKDGFNDFLARKTDKPEFVTGTWPLQVAA